MQETDYYTTLWYIFMGKVHGRKIYISVKTYFQIFMKLRLIGI